MSVINNVALLAEGVGRNFCPAAAPAAAPPSPSSRRAWVEMDILGPEGAEYRVALLAEGVGRNCIPLGGDLVTIVALLAEGVGRNPQLHEAVKDADGRPPRGGRG